jgi:hypothetical protein
MTFCVWIWCKCTRTWKSKKKIQKKMYFLASWKSLTKTTGSGSVSQRYRYENPDAYQKCHMGHVKRMKLKCTATSNYWRPFSWTGQSFADPEPANALMTRQEYQRGEGLRATLGLNCEVNKKEWGRLRKRPRRCTSEILVHVHNSFFYRDSRKKNIF